MRRSGLVLTLLLVGACRQPTNAEVGEQSVRDAQPLAIMKASQRAHEVSPAVIAPAAKGQPMQMAPSKM